MPPTTGVEPPAPPSEPNSAQNIDPVVSTPANTAAEAPKVKSIDFRDWKPREIPLRAAETDESVDVVGDHLATIPKKGPFTTNLISAKKNSTFALGIRIEEDASAADVAAKRSMSFDRSSLTNTISGSGRRVIVGKGLKRGKEIVMEFDELNEESHKVDDKILQNVTILHPLKSMELDAEEIGPEEDENACITIGHHKEKTKGIRRSSELFIGGDGFFPLSSIKMPRPVYFTMRFEDFEDVKHLTDGSNSVIYKARSGNMMSYQNSGIRIDHRIVIKVLSKDVADPRRAKREFDFERDILAAIR